MSLFVISFSLTQLLSSIFFFKADSNAAFAQNFDFAESESMPTVSLTVMLIPETLACRPHGYGYRDSQGRRVRCRPWSALEVAQLLESSSQRIIFTRQNVPPGEVQIGDAMFNALDAYITAPRRHASERKSVLVVFDFGLPQGTQEEPVSISLTSHNKSDNSIYRIDGILPGHHSWIDHVGANAFYPANKVEWTLCLGGPPLQSAQNRAVQIVQSEAVQRAQNCEGGTRWVYHAQR